LLGLSFWVRREVFFASLLFFALALSGKRLRFFAAAPFLLFFLPQPKLAVLDVGQGDAIFFRNAKERWLMDAGPGKKFSASSGLERLGISFVDQLLLTHLDKDHVGGVPELLSRHRIPSV